jgi:hypothetical protein
MSTTLSHTTISSLVDANEDRLKNELRIVHSEHQNRMIKVRQPSLADRD